jgi:putative transposase
VNVVRYRYRLRPGVAARAVLLREWDRCRWVWNQAVARLNESGEWVRDDALTGWRREHDWLRDGSVVAQQQMLRNFRTKRFKGKGRRKFKSGKRTLPSLNYTRRGFAVNGGRLCLAGGLSIPVVWSRELPSEPSSVRVYRDSIGHWYASFVVRRNDHALPVCERAIGIDWGVRAVATTTDPEYDMAHSEYGKRASRELARRQRTMARRKPARGERASKSYLGAKRAVAKLSKKVARQRQDAARRWATKVVANHGALAVEDFKPRFLAKSHMARKSADGAIGATKATLIEYAQRAGRKVVLVPPAYTTMTCSGCGARAKSRLPLSERVFACESCGMIQDRDRNAARVILDRAGLNPAGAEAVRHSDLLEVRVLAEPGIRTV